MLHITNGDSAAETIRRCGIPGEVLSWRDVLHEGPVPAGLSLAELSDVRSRFLSDGGWAPSYDEVRRSFRERDLQLQLLAPHSEVTLWFEADLYDQLQILQLLDWFHGHPPAHAVYLICIGEHPEVPRFEGIGQLHPGQMAALFPARKALTQAVLDDGHIGWQAFTAPDPAELADQSARPTASELPFLNAALRRLLEEYPSTSGGLGRTEQQALRMLAQGPGSVVDLFVRSKSFEERPFMGDLTFAARLLALSEGAAPAVHLEGVRSGHLSEESLMHARAALTDAGRGYLDGTADYIHQNGVDRWFGGTHLTISNCWRWDGRNIVRDSPT